VIYQKAWFVIVNTDTTIQTQLFLSTQKQDNT